MIQLKNWSVCRDAEGYYRMVGRVYGHVSMPDGVNVQTSPIVEVREMNGHLAVRTVRSLYELYKFDVSDRFRQTYPDYYNLMLETKFIAG